MASCVPDADYASLSDAAFLLQVSQGTVAGTGVALVGNGILDLLEIKLKKKKKGCYQICVVVPHTPAGNAPPALWVMARRLFFSHVGPVWWFFIGREAAGVCAEEEQEHERRGL